MDQVFLILICFQIKHFVADGLLQTAAMVRDKGIYGKPLGLAHAGYHGIGTFAVLPLCGVPIFVALICLALDFVVHYHLDYAKEQIVRRNGWSTHDAYFWWSISADQMLHHLTYFVMTYAVLS